MKGWLEKLGEQKELFQKSSVPFLWGKKQEKGNGTELLPFRVVP